MAAVVIPMYVWDIQASEPYKGGDGVERFRDYCNSRVCVLADSMERAIELYREQHPDARLFQVIKRHSALDVIVDPDLAVGA